MERKRSTRARSGYESSSNIFFLTTRCGDLVGQYRQRDAMGNHGSEICKVFPCRHARNRRLACLQNCAPGLSRKRHQRKWINTHTRCSWRKEVVPNVCSVFIVTRIRKQFKCFSLTRRSSSFCLDRSARGRDPVIARGLGATSATQSVQSNGHPLWKRKAECSCEKQAAKLDILVKSYLDHLTHRLEKEDGAI